MGRGGERAGPGPRSEGEAPFRTGFNGRMPPADAHPPKPPAHPAPSAPAHPAPSAPAHPAPSVPDLYGHGLRLRPWDPDSDVDVEAWLHGHTDPVFRRWNTPLRTVHDIDSARESMAARAESVARGTSVAYCVTEADGGAVLGHIGLNAMDPVMSRASLGYWVLPGARGRGVATRALALTSRWAFSELELHRLELDHALRHEASCRIAERCGFRYEGTLRGAMFAEGRQDAFRDAHLHARLATDPEPALG
ncbi:GNAT family N-acetyltransferase [Streptomyces griseoaurantiacus]